MSVRVLLAGTFDAEFERNVILGDLLARGGHDVRRCHAPLWAGRRDSLVEASKLRLGLRLLGAYARLVWRFLRTPLPDVVIVPYPGHFDMLVLGPLARLRRVPVVFDVFISLHDTIVSDRGLRSPRSALGRATALVDRLACRLASIVLADTPQHAGFFSSLTGVPRERFEVLWVGAREEVFTPRPSVGPEPGRVLFYGTYIPLHGIPTIVDAAQELARDPVHFVLIGNGQLRPDIDARLRAAGAVDVEQLGMVPIERLADEIARAQVCLGIFGASGKAARVVPNKVFQCAAMGKAIVTADTPATREAFGAAVATVPAGDAHALAECLRELVAAPERCEQLGARARATYEERFSAARLTEMLDAALTRATQSAGRST